MDGKEMNYIIPGIAEGDRLVTVSGVYKDFLQAIIDNDLNFFEVSVIIDCVMEEVYGDKKEAILRHIMKKGGTNG